MGGPRSKATPEEISSAFQTEEPFKAVAKRIGMSPNTLRKKWKAEFGEVAFKERGKRLQAKAASKQARRMAANRVFRDVAMDCSRCGSSVTLKANQVAHLDTSKFVCDVCKYDRECPVCGQLVDGERGLSGHFRHRREAGDEAHVAYQEGQSDARWWGKVENEDYVVCRECGVKVETLARHLKTAHGVTAESYRAKYGSDVLIRSRSLTRKRAAAIQAGMGSEARKGTKVISCPGCGGWREVSKFVGPLHDHRCAQCKQKDEEARRMRRPDGREDRA